MSNVNDRRKALQWWNSLDLLEQEACALSYIKQSTFPKRNSTHLTGREIQIIWEDVDCPEPHKAKEMVDFVSLNNFIERFSDIQDMYPTDINENCIKNAKLFFDKLSQSSSFAHKAHKELKRISENN